VPQPSLPIPTIKFEPILQHVNDLHHRLPSWRVTGIFLTTGILDSNILYVCALGLLDSSVTPGSLYRDERKL